MRCALAALGFINEDIAYNQQVIIDTMIRHAQDADIVILGEAFLQGFYAATFDVAHDGKIAIARDDIIIREICAVAKAYHIAVSFGFIEKDGDVFYSSQITIDANGDIIDIFRRVSPGWKLPFANDQYQEGNDFHTFPFDGKQISVALCGDLWFDENIEKIKRLKPDIVFWPVYTDYHFHAWNTSVKHEYAVQAGKIGSKVLYVNSYCRDKEGDEIARGGAAFFDDGIIRREIPSGKEDVLLINL